MPANKYNILLINHTWLKSELELSGHKVITAGYRPGFDVQFNWSSRISNLIQVLPKDFLPDRIVYYDDSADPSILDFENAPCPSVFLSVDTHHHYEWHKHFFNSFSHSLIAQKDYYIKYTNESDLNTHVSWFPLWATQNVVPAVIKDIPTSFRGTLDNNLHPGRANFLEAVSKIVPLDYAQGPYPDIYARSKIVLNEAVKGDLNFRVFEGMISGALMITPRISNGMLDLFIDEEDLITYEDGNVEEAASKIDFYLRNEELRLKIAESGRRKVQQYHSLSTRARQLSLILDKVSNLKPHISTQSKYYLYSSKLKALWVYLRKYQFEGIEIAINTLLEEIENLVKSDLHDDSIINQIDDFIFTIDTIHSDLLDEENYEYWLKLIESKFPSSKLVEYILSANSKIDSRAKNPEMLQKLKESRSHVLRGFLSDL